MRAEKDDNGFLSMEQQNHRFINVLQLVYLNAKESNNEYIIDHETFARIETELDFNTNEKTLNKIKEESKKKYRKRKTYLLWSEILSKGNFINEKDARDVLMNVHASNKTFHNSMTHERYAMETMQLALDDHFGTNKLKITPSRFLKRNIKSSNKKKGVKCKQKKKSTQKNVSLQNLNYCASPF
jgi:hypothetical protein